MPLAMTKKRRWFQAMSALVINIYLPGWFKGSIYQGKIKGICVPVLNCYSCPSAVGACPIGSLQNFFAGLRFNLSLARFQFGLYVLGVLGIFGSLLGRIPCGWLCPFGLIQELMYKIPSPKLPIPKIATYFRYVVLAVMVVALPLLLMDEFGMGKTWFCAFLCPAGTLEAGFPLVALNSGIRDQIGFLFGWKTAVLTLFLIWIVLSERAFCRTTCPLGVILGFFNKGSLFRMIVDPDKCAECRTCHDHCPVRINIREAPNSSECIRCLRCLEACPRGAIGYEFWPKKASTQNV